MQSSTPRYLALDVLRGLTVTLMIIVNTPGNEATTYAPLLHATWHGFTLTDLVFPTFLFAVGNALSFSIGKYESIGNTAVLKKIFTRTLLIFLAGFLLYWFPFVRQGDGGNIMLLLIGETRIPGVLQRIALSYCFASLILHYWKARGAIIFSVAALLGYWIILSLAGDYTLQGNAVLRLDRWLLGERHLYHGEGIAFDPEGVLSTLPVIVNVIAGYLAGRFIARKGQGDKIIATLILAGVACVLIALCWSFAFPINKKLWTSPYALLTIGLDLLILPMLMQVIDRMQWRRWTYFFEVFGRNTLFIYLLSEIGVVLLFEFHVGEMTVYAWLYDVGFKPWAGDYNGSLLFALSAMLTCWIVAYVLDRNRIYVKV